MLGNHMSEEILQKEGIIVRHKRKSESPPISVLCNSAIDIRQSQNGLKDWASTS